MNTELLSKYNITEETFKKLCSYIRSNNVIVLSYNNGVFSKLELLDGNMARFVSLSVASIITSNVGTVEQVISSQFANESLIGVCADYREVLEYMKLINYENH